MACCTAAEREFNPDERAYASMSSTSSSETLTLIFILWCYSGRNIGGGKSLRSPPPSPTAPLVVVLRVGDPRENLAAQTPVLRLGLGVHLITRGGQVHVDDLVHPRGRSREHHDPIAEVNGLVDVVGDEHDRHADLLAQR